MKLLQSLFIVAALLPTVSAEAQFAIDFGTGLSHSSVKTEIASLSEEALATGWRTASYLSVAPNYSFGDKITVYANLQYDPKGFSVENAFGPGTTQVIKVDFLDLLPELEYRFHKNIGVSAGGYAGVKIFDRVGSRSSRSRDQAFDAGRRFDFGLTVASRVHYKSFYAVLRYNHGLTDITNLEFTDANGFPLNTISQKSRNFQLGIGYSLKLDKPRPPSEG